jgi:hypothetical protein
MLQMLLPLVAGIVGRQVGKSGAEVEADEKLDLIKDLANLTPAQAQAVDALKKQPIEEVRARHEFGIGPYGQLPANAAQRAQELRQQRIDSVAGQIVITPEERAAIANAPDRAAAIDALVQKKTAEAHAALAR